MSAAWNRFTHFYPRSPCGERPWARGSRVTYVEFLSTLSLRRATSSSYSAYLEEGISIHALLAESDTIFPPSCGRIPVFLSTLSLRRATLAGPSGPAFLFNFYPRSPCGERQLHDWPPVRDIIISIHALLAESDRPDEQRSSILHYFYPRSPCGERPAGR